MTVIPGLDLLQNSVSLFTIIKVRLITSNKFLGIDIITLFYFLSNNVFYLNLDEFKFSTSLKVEMFIKKKGYFIIL